jgi:hypothetical protein
MAATIHYETLDDALDYLRTLAVCDHSCGWNVKKTATKTVTDAVDDDGERFTITRTVTKGRTRGVWTLTESYS